MPALDGIYFTYGDDELQREPFMRCGRCNADLCTIEEGDSLNLIVSCAEHTCVPAA